MPLARVALSALLVFGVAAVLEAQVTAPLSRSERKERIKNLSDKYREFLNDVEPIIHPEEVDAFLRMESDAQRDAFIDDFWKRHGAANKLDANGFKTMYYDRLEHARKTYRSANTDRGRMYMVQGPPADIFKIDEFACRLLQPLEIWTYYELPGVGHEMRLIFYRARDGVEFHLWQNPNKSDVAVLDLVSSEVVATNPEPSDQMAALFGRCDKLTNRIKLECDCPNIVVQFMQAFQESMVTRDDWTKAYAPPPVNKEEVYRGLKSVVIPTPGATKLPSEFSMAFPFRQGERTDAQLIVLVPKSQLVVKEATGTKLYSVDVTGEVLKEGRIFEHYRYRFDYPAGIASDKIAILVDRLLRPGEYLSRMKIADANAKAEAIVESPLSVPELLKGEAEQKRREAGAATVAKIAADTNQTMLRIVPLPDELLAGLQHIDTIAFGDDIKAVEFSLDGRKVMTKRTPPYTLDVDLGRVPQRHRIRVVALNDKGETVAGDEVVVNSGNEPFRVRIVSPRLAPRLHGRTRVEMAVSVPEGKSIEKVELFVNQTRLATLYEAPFVQTVEIPQRNGVAYLRAVATLKDSELAPVEDVVILNSPEFTADVNVHLVELPTTVFRDGRPVNDAKESDFRVLDNGKPVAVAKFEHVSNLPLSLGLAIDTSASMQPRMAEAQKAASQFFANVLHKGDKAFVVSFDLQPQMMRGWSSNLTELTEGLAKLRAEESTSLYDAVAYSLYNFVGVKGRRALV
ncbi:MAG TPA: VWA domain-containing protein, partial [Vicinamibacterales bacterium]|nr:VWA domain-containing protein [Vicinamibacterales bacterium]